ncbi:unnamed protein product [Rotaria socialis]|uniref:Uncharacterized protein n=1 Tax=Rotaria socialis TaxID=392032 RepID=A0A818P6J6_9BILA|nr:unnamed protein product [Rotaria socialis]CAF3615470.1 unnamed protein product [Rotaria socialis]CAF3619458.1 unnamed protein product [Rotaria socialis]CAF4285193.1 unnamed protein product [Rotaria socialis]CAF4447666.1 unnamed protein product [Rotaria socialis]
MSLIVPKTFAFESQSISEGGNKSPSVLSTLSSPAYQTTQKFSRSPSLNPSISNRVKRLQAGPSIEIPNDLSEDENDFDDNASARENYRFAPQVIRSRFSRRSSFQLSTNYQRRFRTPERKSDLPVIQAPPPGSLSLPGKQYSSVNGTFTSVIDQQAISIAATPVKEIRGQTLLHLAARLGHDEILRLLISETSQASVLMNAKGQTPLLTAIEAGSVSTATLLMEADPRSIIANDDNGSSVFHYACEHCSDVVLHRAITLSKRLNSTSDRITALCRITERNRAGKTPFDIAIEKGQLKCVKHIVLSSWLETNIDMRELIDASSMKNAIDQEQFDILTFFVSEPKRFAYIIHLLVEYNGRYFNLLEYAILSKKKDIVRLFISVRIPAEQYDFRYQYKQFLRHYNEPFVQTNSLPFYQTPIQRMLTTPECVPLVPLILEQFVSDNGIDLSIVDDCLYTRPTKARCLFGRTKNFSIDNWLQQHPLSLIAKADYKDVYDHHLVRLCVDLKFNLFGNFLYFIILCCQSAYVALYTGITLGSPTPVNQGTNYYLMANYSCFDLCVTLANDVTNPATDHRTIRALRLILLIISCFALLKEIFQLLTQKDKYFRHFYINLIELHMYVSAVIYSVDVNECTRLTGIRCSAQWMTGGIGLLSVWTSMLFAVMNGIKFGKHGLLFITVYGTFLKFIAVYIAVWIGYILAFYMICKDIMAQFHFFNFVAKLLVMFIGEYDVDSTFFPNNILMPGAEAALILYSAYVFTMFIVMMNIMGGLAVAEVKSYRLNAKREHLRARIGLVLGFQAHLGGLCETFGNIMSRLCRNARYMNIWEKSNIFPIKHDLRKLEIRSIVINVPNSVNSTLFAPISPQKRRGAAMHTQSIVSTSPTPMGIFEQIQTETGYYYHQDVTRNDSLFNEDENTRLIRKTDDIRDAVEESGIRTNNEIRKIALSLQNELEDIKRRLIRQQSQSNN